MTKPNVNITIGTAGEKPQATYKNVILKNSIPFASQLNEENCIYIIKWDFDLKGQSETIPKNCILKFEGGSLKNGTIVGQNTCIEAGLVKIFYTDIVVSGSWVVPEAYPEWFGAIGDNITDCRAAIQKALDSFKVVRLSGKNYVLNSYSDNENKVILNIPSYHTLCGGALNAQHLVDTLVVGSSISEGTVVLLNTWSKIEGIDIKGTKADWYDESTVLVGIGTVEYVDAQHPEPPGHIFIKDVKIFICTYGVLVHSYVSTIEQVTVSNCTYGIWVIGHIYSYATNPRIVQCGCYNIRKQAFRVSISTYPLIENCYGDHNGFNSRDLEDKAYYPVYRIDNSRGGNIISCSAEQFAMLFDFSNAYLNVQGFSGWPNLTNIGVDSVYLIYTSGGFVVFDNFTLTGNDAVKNTFITFASGKVAIRNFHLFGSNLHTTNSTVGPSCEIVDYQNYPKLVENVDNGLLRSKFTIGTMQFVNSVNRPAFFGNDGWFKDANNFSIYNNKGTSEERPNPANLLSSDSGIPYFDQTLNKWIFLVKEEVDGNTVWKWVEFDGAYPGTKRHGTKTERLQILARDVYVGFMFLQIDENNGTFPVWITNIGDSIITWVKADGTDPDNPIPTFGTFALKPTVDSYNIPVGFKYFCTDKQSPEQASVEPSVYGIEIIHKGSDVWVDALGRVVE